MKWPFAILAVIAVVLVGYSVSDLQERRATSDSSNKAEPQAPARQKSLDRLVQRNCHDAGMAFIVSQKFIKRELRSPASASFPAEPDNSKILAPCQWRILAWVDSQNGFGTLVRSRYSVDMRYDPSADRWSAKNLAIE